MKRLSKLYAKLMLVFSPLLFLLLPGLVAAEVGTFTSDDFNAFNLNTSLWTFIDPVGDAIIQMVNTNTSDAAVSISVPAGTSHDLWTGANQAPRLMQPATDTDFELEVEFDSTVSSSFQMQGIIVEQDNNNFLRFDFHHDGTNTKIFAATFVNGSGSSKVNAPITGGTPLYMQIKREGDLWTQSYSDNGISYTPSVSFTHSLAVSAVGLFVGNAGGNPAHTGLFDYFLNTAAPFSSGEDGGTAIDTTGPFMYNLSEVTGDTAFRIDWSTDEQATSTIKYGETLAYELGTVADSSFTIQHSLLVTGLQSATTYNYQLVSGDSSGYVTYSDNYVITTTSASSRPVVNVWYGTDQAFGQLGQPQQWANILGNVSDDEGIASLTYSLNGGPASALSIGPDNRRLVSEGDFNIELAYTDLISGSNEVVITAVDNLSNTTVETVTVEYESGNTWSLPYNIDWSTVTTLTEVAQVVDGLWTLEADSIRPTIIGYDRLVNIGDLTWGDYEITVPITIHSKGIGGPYSGSPGVGLLLRWDGHYAVDGSQPRRGWQEALGALGWYYYGTPYRLQMIGYDGLVIDDDTSGKTLDFGTPYNFKMRVVTTGLGGLYSMKVWEDGQPEPADWDLMAQEDLTEPQNGSVLLLAHHVDASFGDVTIIPLSGMSHTLTVNTDGSGSGSVAIDPDQTEYAYGSVVTLTATADAGSAFAGWSGGLTGSANPANLTITGDTVVTATFNVADGSSAIISDDFNKCSLDTGLWTFINPLGDAAVNVVGSKTDDAWVTLTVPGGTNHDVLGTNNGPRIMQPANDTDFEIEVKFESAVSSEYQMQGLIIEQDNDDFLRLDFHGRASNTRIYAAKTIGGSPSSLLNDSIGVTGIAPLYMRIKREGDLWRLYYSYPGKNWTEAVTFTHAISVSKVGVFAGNRFPDGGGPAPAHTAQIDYFFNTASPVSPEDGDRLTLTTYVDGSGGVNKNPDKPNYSCNESVDLTAVPDAGWSFENWTGDLTSTNSSETLIMNESKVVTATFVNEPPGVDYKVFLPLIIHNK